MKLRDDINVLMSEVKISGEMHRAVLDGKRRKHRFSGSGRALGSAAAVLLALSTLHAGAGYLKEHTPLFNLFFIGSDSFDGLTEVSEEIQRQDIYDEILDSRLQAGEKGEAVGKEDAPGENGGKTVAVPLGEAGEKVIDNEMYSIELLETTCAGREITVSYILTRKAWNDVIVDVWVDTDSYGKILDGSAGEDDFDRVLTQTWFTDRYGRMLREGSGYTLDMNQEFCVTKQLGKQDYRSGEYTLYAMCHTRETEQDGTNYYEKWKDEEGKDFCSIPIEIVGNEKYGFELSGSIGGAVGDCQLEEYGVYISPLNVYLTLSGERPGGSEKMGYGKYKCELVLGFEDGSEVRMKMRERSIQSCKGGEGVIVELKSSFDGAIDPETIERIILNDITIMEK